MSDRPIDIDISTSVSSNIITDEDRELSRAARKAKLVQIYSRGAVGNNLHVDLPNDLVGQWVSVDPTAINRMEALGFQIEKEHAPKIKLHNKGDGASYVGDVVFMTASRETREIIDEIKRERYEAMNNPKKQKEEKDFVASTQTLAEAGITSVNQSAAHQSRLSDIKQALESQPKQKEV